MRGLIKTLQVQHAMIQQRFTAAKEAAQSGDPPLVQRRLAELQVALKAHLDLEERQLYPGLASWAEAAGQQDLVAHARSFRQGSPHIALGLRELCDRHLGKPLDREELGRQLQGLAHTLGTRFTAEEVALFRPVQRMALEIEGALAVDPRAIPEPGRTAVADRAPSPAPAVALRPAPTDRDAERRRLPRVACGGTARVVAPWSFVARVRTISPGGVCLQAPAPRVPVGDRFQFTFLLPGSIEPLAAEGEVCSHIDYPPEMGGPAMGVRFVRIPDEARRQVGRFVADRG